MPQRQAIINTCGQVDSVFIAEALSTFASLELCTDNLVEMSLNH